MQANSLSVQHERRMSEFLHYSKRVKEAGKMEDIHQLRVSVKKLRALLEVTELNAKGQFSKQAHFDLFRPLFKIAGAVRISQVNKMLIADLNNSCKKHYEEYLYKKHQKNENKLLEVLKEFPLERLQLLDSQARAMMLDTTDEKLLQEAMFYVNLKLEEVKRIRRKKLTDTRLHKIRIHLKAVAEILKLMQDIQPSVETKKVNKSITKLNEQLGDWHDQTEIKDSIKNFRKKRKDKKSCKQLQKYFKKKVKKSRKKILKKLDSDLELKPGII